MKWVKICNDVEIEILASNKIEDIANSLEKNYSKHHSLGLADGKAGIVLFFCYYNLYKNTNRFSKQIEDFIEEVNNLVFESKHMGLTFASGYAGIFWLIEFLKEEFIEFEEFTPELLMPFKEFAEKILHTEKNTDFLNGPLGLIFLLTELNQDKETVIGLVNSLRKVCLEKNSTISPPIVLVKSINTRVINLSLSHGISSLIIILCLIYKKHNSGELKNIVYKAIKFLIDSKYKDSARYISIFPSWIEVDSTEEDIYGSRLSWCYGDLGNGLAIYTVAKTFNDENLMQQAIEIFKFNAKRRDFNNTNIKDAEFCHGTSGVAHIYNRLYQETKIDEFRETAYYWYLKTLEFAVHDNQCAGYKTQIQGTLVEDYYLFEGIAGIGLSLISAVSHIEPKWDRCMLIS